jgi:hypothetical protein
MLWHNVMDYLYPLFWTMTTFFSQDNEKYGSWINLTNQVHSYDDDGGVGLFFIESLTNNQVTYGRSDVAIKHCYKNAVLGMRKFSRPFMWEMARSGLVLPYDLDPVGVTGVRKYMLKRAGTSEETCKPSTSSPVVYLIGRTGQEGVRRILNDELVFNATKEMCPSCAVSVVDFQQWDKLGQVLAACNASVLIGIHGSGLVHANWMARSNETNPTAIIEFLPYLYTCRNWYKVMAETIGVEYFAIQTLSLNQSRWAVGHNPTKVHRCHTLEGECFRPRCHDFLRDQSIIADIELYKSITSEFFARLEKSAKR